MVGGTECGCRAHPLPLGTSFGFGSVGTSFRVFRIRRGTPSAVAGSPFSAGMTNGDRRCSSIAPSVTVANHTANYLTCQRLRNAVKCPTWRHIRQRRSGYCLWFRHRRDSAFLEQQGLTTPGRRTRAAGVGGTARGAAQPAAGGCGPARQHQIRGQPVSGSSGQHRCHGPRSMRCPGSLGTHGNPQYLTCSGGAVCQDPKVR